MADAPRVATRLQGTFKRRLQSTCGPTVSPKVSTDHGPGPEFSPHSYPTHCGPRKDMQNRRTRDRLSNVAFHRSIPSLVRRHGELLIADRPISAKLRVAGYRPAFLVKHKRSRRMLLSLAGPRRGQHRSDRRTRRLGEEGCREQRAQCRGACQARDDYRDPVRGVPTRRRER